MASSGSTRQLWSYARSRSHCSLTSCTRCGGYPRGDHPRWTTSQVSFPRAWEGSSRIQEARFPLSTDAKKCSKHLILWNLPQQPHGCLLLLWGAVSAEQRVCPPPFPFPCSFSMSRRMGEGQKTLEERGGLTSFTLLPTSHCLVRLMWLGFSRTQSRELHTGNRVQGPALPVEPKSSHRSKLEFRL